MKLNPEINKSLGGSEPYATADFSASSLQRIDEVCLHFENAWRAGGAPSLESFLDDFQGELRSALFAELLFLDIEYRTAAGQKPDAADYETRFPTETPVIESAFKGTTGSRIAHREVELDYAPPLQRLSVTSEFQLRQFHARGGLGTVYVARDEDLGRNVAVKFSRKRAPSSAEQLRLAREAEITGRLEHPGIVPVYSTGVMENGTPCYFMQLIDGQTLHEAISDFHDSKKLAESPSAFNARSFRQLLQRFIAVCNTVAFAHDHQVIHRDIKPCNIMLGRFGETFLLDWGLAKTIGETETASVDDPHKIDMAHAPSGQTLPGQPMGTPAYASPEQVTGDIDQHNTHSDVYSLGATLYCLLVGKGPVNSEDLTDLETATALRNIPKPRDIDRTVPRQLEAICQKAMAFEPADRYSSAQDLAGDLERFLADEPVTVASEPLMTKLRRWGRKHPLILTGAAASVLVALCSLAVGSYLLGNMNLQLRKSNGNLIAARGAQQAANAETLAALRSLTDEIIERSLSRQPTLTDEDHEFMENVIQRYQRLASMQTEDQKALEVEIEGLYRVGQLKNYLGEKQEALNLWEQAIALNPNPKPDTEPVLVSLIARTHSRIGLLLLEFGEKEHAASEAQLAVDLMSQLIESYPDVNEYATLLARSYSELGVVKKFNNRFDESAEALQKSLEILVELEKRIPNDRYVRQQLASDYSNLGTALSLLERHDEAERQFVPSLDIYNQLVADYPSSHMYELNLARTHLGMAKLQRQIRNMELAKDNCQKSIDLAKSLHGSFPLVPNYCYQLGISYFEMGRILVAMQLTDQALEQFENAIHHVRFSMEKTDGDFRYRQSLLQILLQTSFERQKRNQFDLVEPLAEQCMVLAKQQLTEVQDFSAHFDMARAFVTQGSVYMNRKQFEDALDYYTLADQALRDPETDQQRATSLELRNCIQRALGNSNMRLKQFEEAAYHWQQAFDLTGGNDTALCVLSAYCLANANPEEAFEKVNEFEKLGGLSPPQIFNLACAAAVIAKSAEDDTLRIAAEAMTFALLERASNNNYFQDAKKTKAFQSNPSFSDLSEHPQFIEFVDRLENEITAND